MSDLHGDIMNIPCDTTRSPAGGVNAELAYKYGHRDARHAAAELASAHEAERAHPAEAEGVVAWAPTTALEKLKAGFNNSPCVLTDGPAEFNNVPLVTLAALSAVTAERDRLREQCDLNDMVHGTKGRERVAALLSQNEALREKADKYATIERVMAMLECDEREGGIWTACTLLLIGSAHKMNSAKSVVDQEGVTVAGEQLGNWRVTVERIRAALAAKEG